jgi:hypothetical protein
MKEIKKERNKDRQTDRKKERQKERKKNQKDRKKHKIWPTTSSYVYVRLLEDWEGSFSITCTNRCLSGTYQAAYTPCPSAIFELVQSTFFWNPFRDSFWVAPGAHVGVRN